MPENVDTVVNASGCILLHHHTGCSLLALRLHIHAVFLPVLVHFVQVPNFAVVVFH